ncbi:redoxin domain-containing protein [Winogradskyella sp. PC D3.3]
MKKIAFYTVLCLFLFVACKNEDKVAPQSVEIGDFSFSSKTIEANTPFQITYNGTGELDDSFYYELKHTKSYPYDLEFKNKTATITVPDSISAIAFNIKVDDNYANNNEEGFLFSVVNTNKNTAADTEASKQNYIVNYGKDFGIEGSVEDALNAVEKALKTNPELKKEWIERHLYLARQVDVQKAKAISDMYLSEFSTKQAESLDDYKTLSSVYNGIRDSKRSDSILKIVAEKFPDSDLALRAVINDFSATRELSTLETIFNTHKDQLLESTYASYVLGTLAKANYKKGDMKAFEHYLSLQNSKTDKASLYNTIAWPKAETGEDIEAAMALSKKSLELIKAEQSAPQDKPEYLTPKQYANSLKSAYNMYADTYALLAFKKGEIKEAITYQALAVEDGNNAELNERYIEFLMADKQYKTVMEKASKFIEDGKSTAKLKSYYKDAVTKVDATLDAGAMLAKLEDIVKENETKRLKASMLDDEAPDFTLTNLNGETVTLSSLKGKTVILDFWATWCGPCIAAFPGMQSVATKYKDDENVVFLFIDTFENGKNRIENVSKFLEANNYDFNVLIDPLDEAKGTYKTANAYDVSGIPNKVIIGPSGRINFKSIGYSGSAEKIVTEIDIMIDLLKK